jgi:hypothetical protein
MNEFLLIFRRDESNHDETKLSPEQIQAMMKPWQDWLGGLGAQNKLVSPGARLEKEGKVIKPGKVITDGPYVDIKETIGGYVIIRANSLNEATELASSCPIFNTGGNIEVRQLIIMNDMQ